MSRAWRTLKGYLFWTYDRGSFHYDVMVTLILLFIFVSPHFIDFKDKPAEHLPHLSGLVVTPDGNQGSIWQVDALQVDAQDESVVRVNFRRLLQPIAGPVIIDRTEPVRDQEGHIVAYRAWVRKK